jgi:hypothetical protein
MLAWLCDLLILLGLFGEFDGEQGLHAGVQVEDFTGPAGTKSARVGMLEAVHPGQLITLGLLPTAQREVKMPSQVVITDPRLAELAIRFSEQPSVAVVGDVDAAFMHRGVMPLA